MDAHDDAAEGGYQVEERKSVKAAEQAGGGVEREKIREEKERKAQAGIGMMMRRFRSGK
jgi:hypothetical protein